MGRSGNPARAALQDQIDAAATDARRILGAVGARLDRPAYEQEQAGGPVGEWVAAWRQPGALRTGCPHIQPSPHVLGGLLHQPGIVYCPPCASAVARLDAAMRPDLCDGCDKRSAVFCELTISVGLVILSANVCPPCDEAAKL